MFLLQNCIGQEFNRNGFFVSKNSGFCEEFLHCIRTMVTEVESEFSNSTASIVIGNDYKLKMVGLFALIALHTNIFHGAVDRKLTNKLWDLCRKVPGVTLHGKVMWFPEQFVMSHLPSMAKLMDKKLVQTLASNRHLFLQSKAQSCQNDNKMLHQQVFQITIKKTLFLNLCFCLVEWLDRQDGKHFPWTTRQQFDT